MTELSQGNPSTVDGPELLAAIVAGGEGAYLLWSGRHEAWWAPDAYGYITDRDQAGRFSLLIAINHVVRSAQGGDPHLVTRMVRTPA